MEICQIIRAFSLQTHVVWLPSICQLLGPSAFRHMSFGFPRSVSFWGLQPLDTCRLASLNLSASGAFSLQTHVVWLPSFCQLLGPSAFRHMSFGFPRSVSFWGLQPLDTCRLASLNLSASGAFRHMSFGFLSIWQLLGSPAFRHMSFGFPQSVSFWGLQTHVVWLPLNLAASGVSSLQTHVVWLPSICQLLGPLDTCRLASLNLSAYGGLQPSDTCRLAPLNLSASGAFRHMSFGFPQSVSL